MSKVPAARKPATRPCPECGTIFEVCDPEGRKKWCSPKCKMAGYWRRRLGKEAKAAQPERRKADRRKKQDAA